MTNEQAVRVVYTKYDGSLHWNHSAIALGEDEHGLWLGCPQGTPMRRGTQPAVTFPSGFVMLIPRDGWWTACFNAAPNKTEIYADITTVPQWPDARTVTMVDLDLDVIRRRTGKIILDDEDEFAEHRVRYGYPAEVVDSARRSADWLLAAVSSDTQPFAGDYRRWLERLD